MPKLSSPLKEVYFPEHGSRGVKIRCPDELAICAYLGKNIRYSVVTHSDYESAPLCILIKDKWVLDAQEHTSMTTSLNRSLSSYHIQKMSGGPSGGAHSPRSSPLHAEYGKITG